LKNVGKKLYQKQQQDSGEIAGVNRYDPARLDGRDRLHIRIRDRRERSAGID